MYGDGAAEELVAEALGDRRSEMFLVSKVHAAARDQARHDRGLRGQPPPAEDRPARPVSAALARQRAAGRNARGVRHARGATGRSATGASATSTSTTWKSSRRSRPTRGTPVAANQVLYNLTRRGIEYDLLPWCRTRGIPIMAYSPLEQGLLVEAQDARGDRRAAGRDAGAGGARVGAAAARRHRDSEGGERRARARESRGARHRACAGGSRRARRRVPAAGAQDTARNDLMIRDPV